MKTIGDAVMVASDDPAAGSGAVMRLIGACQGEPAFPMPRAGLHHGPVVERDGDLFGTTVNLAARVAERARGGETLGTAPVAAAATSLGIAVDPLGLTLLRNLIKEVELCALDPREPTGEVVINPACRMQLPRDDAAGRLRHGNRVWLFYSLRCTGLFAAAPDRFVATPQPLS